MWQRVATWNIYPPGRFRKIFLLVDLVFLHLCRVLAPILRWSQHLTWCLASTGRPRLCWQPSARERNRFLLTSETLSNPKLPSYSGVTVNHHTNEPLEVNEFGAGTRTRWMFLPWDARFLSSLLGRFSSLESRKLKNPTQILDLLYRREFADVLPQKGAISSRKSYCYLSLPGVNLVEQVIKIAICFPLFMLSLEVFCSPPMVVILGFTLGFATFSLGA